MGSAVIQTAGQYRYYQERKEDVTKRYYERIKLFKLNRNDTAKKPQVKTTIYCSICKETVKDAKKHIEGIKHSTATIRDKDVYKAIDSIFAALMHPQDASEKVLLVEPTLSTGDTEVEFPKKNCGGGTAKKQAVIEEQKISNNSKVNAPRKKKKEVGDNKKRKLSDLKEETIEEMKEKPKPAGKRVKNRAAEEEEVKMVEIPRMAAGEEEKKPKRRAKKKCSVSNGTLEKYGIFVSGGVGCNNK